ncbi:hypothetical protein C4D60_Mb02t00790 [Musa balbisiana]|uniref:Uncharacterized protein n=1 Tax=Musa balbisiana TaxID=52838 RepID=A0A4S8I7A6_MUSBA|nr:hypothetical protein C4D60_Mb02t00790 [Musa balbisiana]
MMAEFHDDLLTIVGITLGGCEGLMDDYDRVARCQEPLSAKTLFDTKSFEQQLGGRNPYRVLGGRSPKEINPKLRICKGSNTWYQSSVLGISLTFHSHPSSLHNCPKQFPQLLKRSSPNPAIISTTADHLLIYL